MTLPTSDLSILAVIQTLQEKVEFHLSEARKCQAAVDAVKNSLDGPKPPSKTSLEEFQAHSTS